MIKGGYFNKNEKMKNIIEKLKTIFKNERFKKIVEDITCIFMALLIFYCFYFSLYNYIKTTQQPTQQNYVSSYTLSEPITIDTNTISITDGDQFITFMNNIDNGINNYSGYTVYINNNIYIDNNSYFYNNGLGSDEHCFEGFLNGLGNTIFLYNRLDINNDFTNGSLFYRNNGTITNLCVSIDNYDTITESIIDFNGFVYKNYGLIENCIVNATNSTKTSIGICTTNYGTIKNVFCQNFQFGIIDSYYLCESILSTATALRWQRGGNSFNLMNNTRSNYEIYKGVAMLNSYVNYNYSTKDYLFMFYTTSDNVSLHLMPYNDDFFKTYLEGYEDGKTQGLNDGYNSGYNEGVKDASPGYEDTSNFFWSILDAPFSVLKNAFDFEILGVNVGGALVTIISILLVVFVISQIKGA